MGLLSLFGLGSGAIREALQKGAIIIDVRTATEFDEGHIPESINIPVDRIRVNAGRIKALNRPVIFCCNSGARSSTAKYCLVEKGLKNVFNGGSWERVLKIQQSI